MTHSNGASSAAKPLVSLVLPAYNEAGVLEENIGIIANYLETLRDKYRFEVLVVNDGSRDDTGRIADQLSANYSNLRVIHHPSNFGLGQAFKTAFAESRGDYVVTMDVDLSYSPDHIGVLLDRMRQTSAKTRAGFALHAGRQDHQRAVVAQDAVGLGQSFPEGSGARARVHHHLHGARL